MCTPKTRLTRSLLPLGTLLLLLAASAPPVHAGPLPIKLPGGALLRPAENTAGIYLLNQLPDGVEIRGLEADRLRLGPRLPLGPGEGELLTWVAPVQPLGELRPRRKLADIVLLGPGVQTRDLAWMKTGQGYCAIAYRDAQGRARMAWKALGRQQREVLIERRCRAEARRLLGG